MGLSIDLDTLESELIQVVNHDLSILVVRKAFGWVISAWRLPHLDDENAILRKAVVEGSEILLIVVQSIAELNVIMRITVEVARLESCIIT